MKYINEMIKDLREDNDWTQSDVANMIGIPRSTYARYEMNGTNIDLDTLLKLCKLYKITPNDMFGFHTPPYLSNHKIKKLCRIITKYKMDIDVVIDLLEDISKISRHK